MIQARDNLIWVRNAAGDLEPFDQERLAAAVRRRSGDDEEGAAVAEAVAGAVFQYVRDHAPERLVTTTEIAEMVVAVLLLLGYDEVARRGAVEIRLDALAADAGAGFELGFYRDLATALARAQGEPAVRLSGLRACVMRLRGTQRWGAGCRQLAQEILEFVYARAARARSWQVAVVDR